MRKFTPLVLALSIALVSGAFAGDNENATFTVTSSKLLTGVGAGELVEISIDTDGWVDVQQVDVTVEVSSPDHFDTDVAAVVLGADLPDATAFPPGNWRALGGLVEEGTDNRIKIGFALLDPDPEAPGHTGSADFTIRLLTSATLTTDTEASVTVAQVSLGPSATVRDLVIVDEAILVNPPISVPELLTIGESDVSLILSGIGEAEVVDGSAGEVVFGVRFIDPADGDLSGQTITWTITHNGGESAFAIDGGATEVQSGDVADVTSITDETGRAFLTLDAEGGQDASSTSASVAAATSGLDSEGQTVDLDASFTVTWDVPVPAELSGFAGDVTVDGDVSLTWSVPSQTSNLGWEVHRSLDGKLFIQVGNLVPGDGTTDELRQYRFVDTELPAVEDVQYYLRQVDLDGSSTRSQIITVSLADLASPIPTAFSLDQNYPNPFNPETTIEFGLAAEADVQLVIYDLAGQVIRTLISGEQMQAGHHSAAWDGNNSAGAKVGSGVYLYRLTAGEFVEMKKMTLLQ